MHLCSIAQVLALVVYLFAQVDASANATASPARSGIFSSTANQPGALLSDPPNARDEERVYGIEAFGLRTQFATLLTKIKQAVMIPIVDTHLVLKIGWWRLIGLDPSIVYTNLELNQVKGNILSNVWFHIWVKYVDSYNPYYPGKEVSILAKLGGQFDDYRLATMLEQAKSKGNPLTKALGTRLQEEQMEGWRKRSVSPQELHNLLQSDPSHPILLTGRKYEIWNIYFSEYNPGTSMTPFDQLLHTFDYRSLSSLLIASKRSEETATLATKLQLELEKFWLSKGEAPELVFKYLMLDKTPNGLLDNLELELWMRYAHMYLEKTGKDVTLNKIIGSLFDTDQIEMIIKTAETKVGKKLAENL